jgi:hypothetical protein
MTGKDRLAVRQRIAALIVDAVPAAERRAPLADADELASAGITSLVLLQVFSQFIDEFQVDPSLLMSELGELRTVGQLLSLGERLAGPMGA